MKIFCIIPAFNESENIENVIKKVLVYVDKIVIVDDCSNDETLKIISKLNLFSSVIILKHIINRGQGAALQTGNEYAIKNKADIIIHFDADGQFIAKDIKNIIAPILTNKADIVLGSRFLNKKSNMPWAKINIIMPLAHLTNKIFTGRTLTDPQNGFRAMNIKTAKIIKIENDRMAHCSEIIFKTFKNNLKIKEVPVKIIYKDFGQKFSGGFKIIKDLFISRLLH